MLSRDLPDLAGLQLLAAVGRHRSLSAAGAEVGVTQQAASLRIRAMERRLGVPLLLRSARGSELTDAGTLINEWAGRLLADAEEFVAGVASLRTGRAAHLRIASSLTIAEHLLPGWLVRLRDTQARTGEPVTDVELAAVNTDAVIARVRAGEADVGFIEGPGQPTGLRSRVIGTDELLVVVRPDHPWTRRRTPLTAEVLARTPMIGRELGSGSRQWFDEALDSALPAGTRRVPLALEVDTATAVRAAAVAGLGPAAISSLVVADDLQLGRLRSVEVAGLSLRRTLRAIWLGDSRPPAGPVTDLLALARALHQGSYRTTINAK